MQSENDIKLQSFLLTNKIKLYIVRGKNLPSLRIRYRGFGVWLPVNPCFDENSRDESLPFRVFQFFRSEYHLLSAGYQQFLLQTSLHDSPQIKIQYNKRRKSLDSLIHLLDTLFFDILSILSEGKSSRLHSLISKQIVVKKEKEYFPLDVHTIDSFQQKLHHLEKHHQNLEFFIRDLNSDPNTFYHLQPHSLYVNLDNSKLILPAMIQKKELKK